MKKSSIKNLFLGASISTILLGSAFAIKKINNKNKEINKKDDEIPKRNYITIYSKKI